MKLRSGFTAGAAASKPPSPGPPSPPLPSIRLDDLPQALHRHLHQYLNPEDRQQVTLTSKTWCLLCRSLTTALQIGWEHSCFLKGEFNPISPAQVDLWLSLRPHLEKLTFLSCRKRSLPVIGICLRLVTYNPCSNLRHFKLSTVLMQMEIKSVVAMLRSMPLLEKLELDQFADFDRYVEYDEDKLELPGLSTFFQALAEGVCPRLHILDLNRILWGNEQRDSFVDALEARQRGHPQCPGLIMVPFDLTLYEEGAPAFGRFLRLYLPISLEVLHGVRGDDQDDDWDESHYAVLVECFLDEEMKSAMVLKELLLSYDYLYPSDEVPSARDAILAAGKAPNLTTLHIKDIGELDAPALEELCVMLSTNQWPFLEDLSITNDCSSSLRGHTRLLEAMMGSSHGFPHLRELEIDLIDSNVVYIWQAAAAETRAALLPARNKFPVLRILR